MVELLILWDATLGCCEGNVGVTYRGLLLDDFVPRMHMMDDLTAAKDSLHLSQLITTLYGFCSFQASTVFGTLRTVILLLFLKLTISKHHLLSYSSHMK